MIKTSIKISLVIGFFIFFIFLSPITSSFEIVKNKDNTSELYSLDPEVLFSDDFDDNSKEFGKWTEIYEGGDWYEQNQRTEFKKFEQSPIFDKEGIESIGIFVSLQNIPVSIECDMNTFIDNYPNPTSQRIGQSHIRIVDKDDPDNRYIDVFYDRDLDEIILLDSQGTFKPIAQSDEFNSKVVFTIYKDNYTVEIGDHSSGIIYKSIFSSRFTIKIRLYILIHGTFPDYWWSAGFDNLVIRGEKDNNPPEIKIKKPEKALYLFNIKILPRFFRITKIVGTVTIEINATDASSGIEKVEFYINGKYMANDTTEPYTFNWKGSRPRLFHLFLIKVIAYDNAGNSNIDKMLVRKFL